MKFIIDCTDVKIENGKIIIEADTEKINEIFETDPAKINEILNARDKVELSTLKIGDEFKLGDEVFIVLEHTDEGTRVISKEVTYLEDVKFGDCNNWKKSYIRTKLGNEYYKKIHNIVGRENIISMVRDLTSLDGLDDYGQCVDIISLLTATEYAKYHKILGLKSHYPAWWWLITPTSTPSNNYAYDVCYVVSSGVIRGLGCDCHCAIRPYFQLNSNIRVEVVPK